MNQEFLDPILLSVKMFLADFPWIRNSRYVVPYNVCTHYTREVVEAATKIKMRCACAIIYFKGKQIAHAIAAFNTDYGLIYIEPQSGEQEHITAGNKYPSKLSETGEGEDIVERIELIWNNDSQLKWLECKDCGYVLPTTTITDFCLHCRSINTNLIKNWG